MVDGRHQGLTTRTADGRPVFNGRVRDLPDDLDLPLRTKRPSVFFAPSEGDLFAEGVTDTMRDRVLAVMAMTPHHLYLTLTKRTAAMREYMSGGHSRRSAVAHATPLLDPLYFDTHEWPLTNLWLGFSAEDQDRFDERWTPMEALAWDGWLVWASLEPMLGPIDATGALWSFRPCKDCPSPDPSNGQPIHENCCRDPEMVTGLSWVVAGGESGRDARPAHPDWFNTLRDDCASAEVPFFFKQWGEWLSFDRGYPGIVWQDHDAGWASAIRVDGKTYTTLEWAEHGGVVHARVGKKAAGRLLDDVEHNAFPMDC